MSDYNESDDEGSGRRATWPGLEGIERLRALERRLERSESDRAKNFEIWQVDRAMLFGHEGHIGRFASLESAVKEFAVSYGPRLAALENWRTSITAKMAVAIAIGTPIAGAITALLVKWIAP